jgi:CheY-like chemotaxis protein
MTPPSPGIVAQATAPSAAEATTSVTPATTALPVIARTVLSPRRTGRTGGPPAARWTVLGAPAAVNPTHGGCRPDEPEVRNPLSRPQPGPTRGRPADPGDLELAAWRSAPDGCDDLVTLWPNGLLPRRTGEVFNGQPRAEARSRPAAGRTLLRKEQDVSTEPLPSRQSYEELTRARLEAIETWHRALRTVESAAGTGRLTREERLDLNRRQAARQREHEALLARSEQVLRPPDDVLAPAGPVPVRAVLAHRNVWVRDRVAQRLAEAGVEVVGVFEDGADAAGTVVAEQPDLVLVEDLLPTMPGLQVVRRVRTFAPQAVTGASVADGSGIEPLLEAGASAVFTRRVRPDEVADHLLRCLTTPDLLVTVG